MEAQASEESSSSSSSSLSSLFYDIPLFYSVEDIRPRGGIKKFRTAEYSNVSFMLTFLSSYFILILRVLLHVEDFVA